VLVRHARWLRETVGVDVSDDGRLLALPLVLPGYLPNVDAGLPLCLLRLGTEVPWPDTPEDVGAPEVLAAVCQELARLYASPGASSPDEPVAPPDSAAVLPGGRSRWVVEHVLFPALRTGFHPSRTLVEAGAILQVADLPELYRIFERC
jgi:DNA mismatch repair protein MLH1